MRDPETPRRDPEAAQREHARHDPHCSCSDCLADLEAATRGYARARAAVSHTAFEAAKQAKEGPR